MMASCRVFNIGDAKSWTGFASTLSSSHERRSFGMQFLHDGPDDASVTILLAHGAGAPMDSENMNAVTAALVAKGFHLARFEFAYMAARRQGARKPPPKAELVMGEYRKAIEELGCKTPLIIGGKSMGGRVASMIAGQLHDAGKISGLLCLGYPFHPPAKPEQLRTAHLMNLSTPTLICQGTRDQSGTREEVENYHLSKAIELLWLEDGDHDLKPRKKISGFSAADHLATLASTVREWSRRIGAG
jgi:predicted alpha/beta-hydrolase family hydrolase